MVSSTADVLQRCLPFHWVALLTYFYQLHFLNTNNCLKISPHIFQRGSHKVWEINMGVCQCLEFDDITLINCLWYDFYIYGAFEFLCHSIVNEWRHV